MHAKVPPPGLRLIQTPTSIFYILSFQASLHILWLLQNIASWAGPVFDWGLIPWANDYTQVFSFMIGRVVRGTQD